MSRTEVTVREYQRYWNRLKNSEPNKYYGGCRVIHCKVPELLIVRMKRMISKEKDMDWEFKQDNYYSPHWLRYRVQPIKAGSNMIILTILLCSKDTL